MGLSYTLSEDRPVQLGLIVLQADESLEPDMRRLLPKDVELLVSRVPSGETLSTETIRQMETHLTQAASLLPRGTQFAVVGYGCTSGTAEIGAEKVASLISVGVQTASITEPVSALIAACKHLNIKRLGLISPYVETVSDRLHDVLEQAGIAVTAFASFEEDTEAKVVRIAPTSIKYAAIDMGRSADCDGIFLSCTNLRTLDVIDPVEAAIGKPVLSSNQVLAWDMLRHAGQVGRRFAPGRLFNETPSK